MVALVATLEGEEGCWWMGRGRQEQTHTTARGMEGEARGEILGTQATRGLSFWLSHSAIEWNSLLAYMVFFLQYLIQNL